MTNETAIIEVSIPMHYLNEDEGDDSDVDQCGICYQRTCHRECSRYETATTCCHQVLCSACMLKTSMRCKCTMACEQIICICPFCRDISQVDTLTLYNAHKPTCKKCTEEKSRDTADEQV